MRPRESVSLWISVVFAAGLRHLTAALTGNDVVAPHHSGPMRVSRSGEAVLALKPIAPIVVARDCLTVGAKTGRAQLRGVGPLSLSRFCFVRKRHSRQSKGRTRGDGSKSFPGHFDRSSLLHPGGEALICLPRAIYLPPAFKFNHRPSINQVSSRPRVSRDRPPHPLRDRPPHPLRDVPPRPLRDDPPHPRDASSL